MGRPDDGHRGDDGAPDDEEGPHSTDGGSLNALDDRPVPPVLRSFVDAVPTPTLACDPETRAIRAANAPAADLLDRDRGTLTLMGLADLGEADETVDGDPIGAAVDAARDAEGSPASSGPSPTRRRAASNSPSARRRSGTASG